MITIYIKPQLFFKNVDEYDNIFEVENEEIYLENGFTKIELEETYKDCVYQDFNEDLTFSVEKYNARKQKELDQAELKELQVELTALSQDIIQAEVGAFIDNLEERKARFQVVHNRIREIMGKEPRVYNNTK